MMKSQWMLAFGLSVGLAVSATPSPSTSIMAAEDTKGFEFFEKKIRPVLNQNCYGCHSADAPAVKSGLRLDSKDGILKGGSRGPAIVPGKPAESLLLKALRQEGPKMPPKGKLTDNVIADFEQWIAMGAPDPRTGRAPVASPKSLWSLTPPKRHAVPTPKDADWARTDVDRFVLSRMEAEGLKPVRDADPASLLRRVSFDLTGLPPTPEEVDAFVRDPSPASYEKLVDKLLASPAFGERWGRHWLDVARFAESNGNADNNPFEHAWRYRDWVIDAFNAGKPYDQFVTEQLAGDLLPASDSKKRDANLTATGFLAMMSKPRAQNNPNYGMDIVAEQIEVTATALMGLTVGCARCHDHKYDPITTKEYYGLAGIFTSSDLLAGPEGNQNPKKKKGKLGELHHLSGDVQAMGVRDGSEAGDCALCIRGESNDRGAIIPRGFPAALAGFNPPKMPKEHSGRLELAKWLTSGQHPLTSRVMVNRVWQHLFGRGIVPTADNFGTLGEKPTHPELLDTLSVRFVEQGWSVKRLIKLLVLTRTYRLSSDTDTLGVAKDPGNVFLWHSDLRRLEAESVRDAILSASGQLDLNRPNGTTATFGGNKKSPAAQKENRYRSVYLPAVRGAEPEVLNLFDAADSTLVIGSRDVTTVPSQALYLLNGPFVIEQSQHTAKRIVDADAAGRAELAWRLILSRPPTTAERDRAMRYIATASAELSKREKDAKRAELAAWAGLCQALFASAEFRYLN